MNCNYSKEKGSAFTYNELAIKPIHLQILISQPKKKTSTQQQDQLIFHKDQAIYTNKSTVI